MHLACEFGGRFDRSSRPECASPVTGTLGGSTTARVVQGRRTHLFCRLFTISPSVDRSGGLSGKVIATMQTAKFWHRYDPATNLGLARCFTTGRRSLRQRKMCSILVIIAYVLIHQPFQMALVENDHMVEQIAAAVADPALGDTVLPRTPEARLPGLNAEVPHRVDDFLIEVCAAIKSQVTGCSIVWKRLAQLLDHPGAVWMQGHVAVKDSPPIVRNAEESMEHAEGERGDREEIHRRNDFAVIAQKRRTSLCRLWISWRSPHPTQNSSLRNIEAQHLKLAMNARRTPGGVLGYHAEDAFAQLLTDTLPARPSSMARELGPIQLEPCLMPANNGFRLDENQRLLPCRPETLQRLKYTCHTIASHKPCMC
jgi:hypothetical protein